MRAISSFGKLKAYDCSIRQGDMHRLTPSTLPMMIPFILIPSLTLY